LVALKDPLDRPSMGMDGLAGMVDFGAADAVLLIDYCKIRGRSLRSKDRYTL
jgi:hypothetical protein